MQRGFQLLARAKVVALQHRLDPAVAALDPAVRRGNHPPDRFLIRLALRVLRWRQAMFDGKVGAKLIKRVPAGGAALAQAEQAVGEFAAARHWLSDQWRTWLDR